MIILQHCLPLVGILVADIESLRCANLQAFSLGAQELQLQAWGSTAGKLYSVGSDLAAIDTRIVVKLPITDAGVEAAGLLKSQNVRVTLTGTTVAPASSYYMPISPDTYLRTAKNSIGGLDLRLHS